MALREYVMPPLEGATPRGPGRPAGSGMSSALNELQLPDGDTKEPEVEIAGRITRTFRVFDKMIQQIIGGDCTALVVSGAGGIGKTFGAEKALKEAADEGVINLTLHNTTISAVELYKLLYANQNPGQVTVIDDCDSIWFDGQSLGILKSALDTKDQRIVRWGVNSWVLNNDGIPNEFEYRGTCIFITNLDISKMIEKGGKFARHWAAFLSRTTYLDMGIHSKREVLVRIKQVLATTDFLPKHQLTKEQGAQMVKWIEANIKSIRALSVRTCIELGRLIRNDPDWQDIAEVTLFKRS